MNYQIGMQVVKNGKILGNLSDFYKEAGVIWGVIDGDFELPLTGAAVMLDLFGTARRDNPALPSHWLEVK